MESKHQVALKYGLDQSLFSGRFLDLFEGIAEECVLTTPKEPPAWLDTERFLLRTTREEELDVPMNLATFQIPCWSGRVLIVCFWHTFVQLQEPYHWILHPESLVRLRTMKILYKIVGVLLCSPYIPGHARCQGYDPTTLQVFGILPPIPVVITPPPKKKKVFSPAFGGK